MTTCCRLKRKLRAGGTSLSRVAGGGRLPEPERVGRDFRRAPRAIVLEEVEEGPGLRPQAERPGAGQDARDPQPVVVRVPQDPSLAVEIRRPLDPPPLEPEAE